MEHAILGRPSFAQDPGTRAGFGAARFGRAKPGPAMGRADGGVTTLWSLPSLVGVGTAALVLLLVGVLRGDGLGAMLINAVLGVGVFVAATLAANELLYGGRRRVAFFGE